MYRKNSGFRRRRGGNNRFGGRGRKVVKKKELKFDLNDLETLIAASQVQENDQDVTIILDDEPKKGKKKQEVEEKEVAFRDFNLHPKLQSKLDEAGFTTPTRIQSESIPVAIKGTDIIGLSNTGSGKTLAFLIPLLHKFLHEPKGNKALIVAPTRELALQIEEGLLKLEIGLRSACCIGGADIRLQKKKLARRPHFVIGTPGRLLDLERGGSLDFGEFNHIVLDEVDKMFDMGFINDIEFILSKLPRDNQALFFSATIDAKGERIISQNMTNPVFVDTRENATHSNIEQNVVKFKSSDDKMQYLVDLLGKKEMKKVIIFSHMKAHVDRISDTLYKYGIRSESLHGDKSQSQRQRSVNRYKKGKTKIIVATNVAARGLDIDDVTHVINYELPLTQDEYIHRIGRTGRGGKSGVAYTFVDM